MRLRICINRMKDSKLISISLLKKNIQNKIKMMKIKNFVVLFFVCHYVTSLDWQKGDKDVDWALGCDFDNHDLANQQVPGEVKKFNFLLYNDKNLYNIYFICKEMRSIMLKYTWMYSFYPFLTRRRYLLDEIRLG